MKKLSVVLVLLLSVSMLQGCLITTAATTGVVAAKVAIDPRSTGSQIDDVSLYSKINYMINNGKYKKTFEDARISASSYDRNILLVGQAKTQEQITRANEIVSAIDGVENVYNQIRISKPVGMLTSFNDAWITSKVVVALMANSDVRENNIKVVTEDGEVFLAGLVTRNVGAAAANIASQVSGVKSVTLVYGYTN